MLTDTPKRLAGRLVTAVASGFRTLRRGVVRRLGLRPRSDVPRPATDRHEPTGLAPHRPQCGARYGALPQYGDTVPTAAFPRARARGPACPLCGDLRPSPLGESPDGGRYCGLCHEAVAIERWTPKARAEQARVAQAEAADWARDVLVDPRVLLLVVDRTNWTTARVRAETVGGEVVIDSKVRLFDDLHSVHHRPSMTTREIEAWIRCHEGTLGPTEFQRHSERIAASRPIMWHAHGIPGLWPVPAALPAEADAISLRLTLWEGRIPYRGSHLSAEPPIPVHHPVDHHGSTEQHHGDDDLATEIETLRCLLLLMAYTRAPEPDVGGPADQTGG